MSHTRMKKMKGSDKKINEEEEEYLF